MTTVTTVEFITRLGVGLGCGALIGIERQWRARTAGLRTICLVAAGATLFVLYSDISGNNNTTQVAAYVVSGVGFLGGGVILRHGFNVSGLNTAATLWCAAAVGVLAASGRLPFAVIGTAAVLAVHLLGRPLGRRIDRGQPSAEDEDLRPYQLYLTCRPKTEQHIRALIVQDTGGNDVVLRGVHATRTDQGNETAVTVDLMLNGDAPARLEQLTARLSLEPGIHAVHWHAADQAETPPVR